MGMIGEGREEEAAARLRVFVYVCACLFCVYANEARNYASKREKKNK